MKLKELSPKMKKGIIIAAAATLTASVAVVGGVAIHNNKNKGNEPEPTPTPTKGLGVFYYDTGIDEYQLSLGDGNKVTFIVGGESKVGTYTNENSVLTITFDGEEGQVTATLDGDVLIMNYNDAQWKFFKKVYYTVSYDEVGGGEVADVKVVNGKTVAKPADPVREGYEFLGWYLDSEYQTPYMFDSQIVTSDITLYAQWALVDPSVVTYVVDFDLGYEATAPEAMETIGGKIYNVPVPTREGYKFCGWWISMYEDAEKLTYKYTPDTVFTANTTLFAVWESEDLGSKLSAPMVEVAGNSIKWEGTPGVSIYRLKVRGPEGFLAIDEDVSATNYTLDFDKEPAGDYQIEVTAVAANQENNSETVKRSFINKALGRVSQFSVINGKVLLFNRVENAEVYYITVTCGSSAHNHVMYNNGDSTYFSFANCDMAEGGIRFTVTATADGYAPVESETYVYNRVLDKVEWISVDEETQVVTWSPVKDAMNYIVSVSCGNDAHAHELVNVGSKTSYSLKECSMPLDGEIKISVYAQTKGYNSPEPTEYSYSKTMLPSPSNVAFSSENEKYILSWDAVGGDGVSYEIKIGNVILTSDTAEIDLTQAITWIPEMKYEIEVRAKSATNQSAWSDAIDVYYKMMTKKPTYKAGVVTWEPVIGAIAYEVRVNDGSIQTIDNGDTFAEIELTQEGKNTVYVRYLDGKVPSAWTTFEIENAKEISFDSRGGSEVPAQYKLTGDPIEMPVPTREGYDFKGWYNTPKGPESNGALYQSGTFEENTELVLYAYWEPAAFNVEYVVGADGALPENVTFGKATYTKHYQLAVPTVNDGTKVFLGWFAGTSGASEQLTDDRGYSLKPWALKQGATVYAQYVSNVLQFTMLEDGTYSVSRGLNASKLTSITVPAIYNSKPVTVVDGYAFQNCSKLVAINIPDTIRIVVEESAFTNCRKLQQVNIYQAEDEPYKLAVYSSVDGVLLHKNEITSATELCYYPKARTGAYEIPEGVTEIPLRLFEDTQVTEVIVPTTVTVIRSSAFINCATLRKVTFAEGGTDALVIESEAFKDCIGLTNLTLPARLSELKLDEETHTMSIFTGCTALTHINVERGNQVYASNDGVITNKSGTELIFCPTARKGSYTVPQGIESIGAYAFSNCVMLTEIVIPGYVETVNEHAFAGCSRVARVLFSGGAVAGMQTTIGEYAFADMTGLKVIEFAEGSVVSSLGAYAFSGAIGLRTLTIPTTMQYIGDYAFEKAEALAMVAFANGNEGELEFGNYVFSECLGLTRVELPKSVTKLNLGVFDGCVNIAEIKVDTNNEYYKDDDGVVLTKDGKELVFFPKGRKTETGEYVIPEGVESISEGAFRGMRFISKIEINNTISNIGKFAFADCSSLTELTFEAGNETVMLNIDDEAFKGCAGISAVTLPARTQRIGNYAFYGVSMSSVSFPAGLEEIGNYAFAGTAITSVEIPAGVTSFGEGVFDGCIRLTTVTYAPGYTGTSIPVDTFKGTAITSIVIPASIETIGYGAFNNCEKLKTVTFEDGNAPLVIGAPSVNENSEGSTKGVFMACVGLTTLDIPDRVTYIGEMAFANCTALAEANLNETSNLQRFGESSFMGCTSLASIFIPKTVQNTPYVNEDTTQEYAIGKSAFSRTGITEVTFGEGGEGDLSIAEGAFAGCGRVTGYVDGKYGPEPVQEYMSSITLPNRVAPIYVVENFDGTVYAEWKEGISSAVFSYGEKTPLQSIHVEEGSNYYASKDGVLYKKAERNGEYVLDCPLMIPAYMTSVEIPYTVSNIVAAAKQSDEKNTYHLTTVTFEATPEGVDPVELTIADSAFSSVKSLKNFELPERLVYIGTSAFSYTSLTSVHLPSTLRELAARDAGQNESSMAFSNITTLTSLTFAEGIQLRVIPGRTFYGCKNANFKTVTIPAGIERIGAYAFQNCKFTSLVFEEGSRLITIGNGAFSGSKLTDLTLPDSFTTIDGTFFGTSTYSTLRTLTLPKSFISFMTVDGNGQDRFFLMGLSNLQNVFVDEENPYFKDEDGVVYTKDGTELIYYPRGKAINHTEADGKVTAGKFVTPAGTQSIGAYAFHTNSKLKSLVISADLLYINYRSFQSCTGLKTIEFEDRESPLKLADYAFNGCSYLGGIAETQEDGSTRNVFRIPESVCFEGKSVFNGAFKYSSNVYIVFEGENESTSMTQTFNGATKIVGVENLPTSLASMNQTFNGCTGLKTVTFNDSKNGMIATMAGTFKGCTALTSIDLPAVGSLTNTNAVSGSMWTPGATGNVGVFQGCIKLESVTIKDCNTIGVAAFMNCTSLTSIDLPDNIVNIGQGAFYGCTKLQNVDMPANLEVLDNYAFMNCSALQSIEIHDFVSEIKYGVFDGCRSLTNVTLGAGLLSIGERAFYGASNLQTVEFPDMLHSIAPYAFYGCSSMGALDIPASVTEIAEYAFAECGGIQAITGGEGLTILGDYAFMGCSKVESFVISDTLTSLGIGVFSGWTSLKDLSAGSNLDYAFKDGILYNAAYTKIIYVAASAAGRFEIPETVTALAEGLFAGTAITEIVIPDTITEIPAKAFQDCKDLTTVHMPAALEKIGDEAFKNCVSLKSITIPKTVYSTFDYELKDVDGSGRMFGFWVNEEVDGIGHAAFYGCTSLENVIFEEGGARRLSFGDFAFYGCTSLKGTLIEGTEDQYQFVIPNRVRGGFVTPDPSAYIDPVYGLGSGDAHRRIDQGIGMYAFARCTALENVVFEDEGKLLISERLIISIGAFQECASLKSVKFGTTLGNLTLQIASEKGGVMSYILTAIAENAFKGCSSLTSVAFPEDVSKIFVTDSSFADLKVELPASLTITRASNGVDYGDGKANWDSYNSAIFGIDGCTSEYCEKSGHCESYDPHNGLFV